MDPGQFSTRVAVLSNAAPEKDSYNAPIEAWPERTQMWADVTPQAGREDFRAAKDQASMPVRVATWWTPAPPTTAERLRVLSGPMNGAILEILGVAPSKNVAKTLVLNCRQFVGDDDGA